MSIETSGPQEEDKQIVWTIHETNPDLVAKMREKLSEVIDPELGMDIIQLGLVRDFSVTDSGGHLKMVLTTPFCPYGPEMIEFTRVKAEVGLGKPVVVELIPEVWNFSYMENPDLLSWGMY